MDEPTEASTPVTTHSGVGGEAAQANATTPPPTMEEVEELCSRVAIMDGGSVPGQEELKELVSSEDTIVVELANVNYTWWMR